MTALLFAVRDGNMPMTRLLLDSGADIQLASANDTSPLIIAILNGQTEIASYLLNRGANPNAIDAYKRGPLFAAIDLRNFNHEKYPDLPTDGRDPLDLIKALLVKGANPNQQTNTTPVHGLMQFDGSWVNFDGQTPLIRAALSGDAEVMKLLLQYKADAKITTDGGTTSLMAAAGINWIPAQTYMHSEEEYVEAVNLCLAQGVDVNAANSMGLTAMHGAANRGWESIVQILADHGSKLDPKDKEGRTPMIFAQGIFLAIKPPEPKPKAMALLNKLMGQTPPAVNRQVIMKRVVITSAVLLIFAGVTLRQADGQQPSNPAGSRQAAQHRALVNQYCVTCHNEKLKTGDLMLDKLDLEHVGAQAETWEKVARKVRAGLMPPSGAPRPQRAALAAFAEAVEQDLDRAAAEHF